METKLEKLKKLIRQMQKNPTAQIAKQYNAIVLGFHNYDNAATLFSTLIRWVSFSPSPFITDSKR